MSKTEQDHIVSAISFELGKCDDPIVHKNALNQINHVRLPLPSAVLAGWLIEYLDRQRARYENRRGSVTTSPRRPPRQSRQSIRIPLAALPTQLVHCQWPQDWYLCSRRLFYCCRDKTSGRNHRHWLDPPRSWSSEGYSEKRLRHSTQHLFHIRDLPIYLLRCSVLPQRWK